MSSCCSNVGSRSRYYHVSGLCPRIVPYNSSRRGEVYTYSREADAVIAGYKARCPLCYAMYLFLIRIEDTVSEFLLNDSEIGTLRIISDMVRKGEYVSNAIVAKRIGLHYERVHEIVKQLRRLKLVTSTVKSETFYIKGSRKMTPWGDAVIIAHHNKMYLPPFERNDSRKIIIAAYNRLI